MAVRTSLSSFKVTGPLSRLFKWGANSKEREIQSQIELEQREAAASALSNRLWLGARLPFVAFTIILGAFTYCYHFLPILPWFLVFLALDFAILVTWPPKDTATKHRKFWDWGPMWSWILAVSCAIALGLFNYANLEGFVNVQFLTEYDDVRFDTDPRAVSDAGVLNFAKGTFLDTRLSAGYQPNWFRNYCAAPVVSTGDPASAPVGFWAVGTDCCDSRGAFTCDAAGEGGATSGMPIRPRKIGDDKTASFNKAIKMAAAAHGLEVAKEAVFVMWAADPHNVGKFAWWTATLTFLFLVFVGLCACCACQQGFTHINVLEQSSFAPASMYAASESF